MANKFLDLFSSKPPVGATNENSPFVFVEKVLLPISGSESEIITVLASGTWVNLSTNRPCTVNGYEITGGGGSNSGGGGSNSGGGGSNYGGGVGGITTPKDSVFSRTLLFSSNSATTLSGSINAFILCWPESIWG